jgi:DNA-binding LytR/AlgR family response regulator
MNAPRAIIADDEAPLRADLQRQLARGWPELRVVGAASNGVEALALIERHRPDLAFLDIQMPGMTGLDVAARAPAACRVVFVTAYDQYAVQAFENAAVDYVLKPVTQERLTKTVTRLRAQLDAAPADTRALLQQITQVLAPKPDRLRWIKAARGEEVQLLAVDDVVYFQAADKYTSVFTREHEWIIRTPLKELETQLDPDAFWRIHRNAIVRVADVARVTRDFRGRCLLELRSRGETLSVSRAYAQQFKGM